MLCLYVNVLFVCCIAVLETVTGMPAGHIEQREGLATSISEPFGSAIEAE